MFRVDTNGDERCFPSDPSAVQVSLVFADSACSSPIAEAQGTCGALPPAFSYVTPGECGARARQLGAQLAGVETYYRLVPSGETAVCTPTQATAGILLYAVHNELAPADLIAGTFEIL